MICMKQFIDGGMLKIMSSRIINSICIKHYRGIKEESVLELPEKNNIAFLVGPNNSGKSLITRVLSLLKIDIHEYSRPFFLMENFQESNFFNFEVDKPINVKFNINTQVFSGNTDALLVKILKIPSVDLNIEIRKTESGIICGLYLSNETDTSHIYNMSNRSFDFITTNKMYRVLQMDQSEIENLCIKLYNELKRRILVFDSIRSFDRTKSDFYKNGSDLVDWLHEEKSLAEIMSAKRIVKDWLNNEFNLDVPTHVKADNEIKELVYTFNDLVLSSSEIGTGYTMLYILLMEMVRHNKEIIMIDEIESHLQPGLIRILINLIRKHGKAQFIIATHSSTVMETAGSDDILYRFAKNNEVCKFENFYRNSTDLDKLREVFNELGVVPGDALLSNTVIWVEGPSEMFWLRSWLRTYFKIYRNKYGVESNLIEGLHYSILMTGGSNIAHYGFQEGEVPIDLIEEDDLLKVLKVNPNPFVIIDSDNSKIGSAKFQRLIRIGEELNKINHINHKFNGKCLDEINEDSFSDIVNLWVLKGKELENYAHPNLLKEFYTNRSLHPTSIIEGVEKCTDWDVFHNENGAGYILTSKGITNVAKSSGTLIHKNEFARFVFKNLEEKHFELEPDGIEKPNKEMLNDLIENLDKILNYILTINDIKQRTFAQM